MRSPATEPRDTEADTLLVGRIPLRLLLAHGLDDVLRLGSEFTGHETHPDGTVTAHFADGSRDHGDLLVGADGIGSRVATALAGRPTSRPTGISGIAARTPLTDEVRARLPDAARRLFGNPGAELAGRAGRPSTRCSWPSCGRW